MSAILVYLVLTPLFFTAHPLWDSARWKQDCDKFRIQGYTGRGLWNYSPPRIGRDSALLVNSDPLPQHRLSKACVELGGGHCSDPIMQAPNCM